MGRFKEGKHRCVKKILLAILLMLILIVTCSFGNYRLAMCPYYIVKDGKPEIAIYGKNYKEGYGDFK